MHCAYASVPGVNPYELQFSCGDAAQPVKNKDVTAAIT
jgi:hypothetical protein